MSVTTEKSKEILAILIGDSDPAGQDSLSGRDFSMIQNGYTFTIGFH